MLSPPEKFGIVERGIYRSNIPHTTSFGYLKLLGLKTAVILSPEVPTRSLTTFLEDGDIKLIHLGLDHFKPNLGWKPVSEEIVKEALELALDPSTHPILFMWIHETGIVIGCLRKLLDWNYNSAIMEYRSFAGNKSRYVTEQFIELFDLDLIRVPENVPLFYQVHQRLAKEEQEQVLNR